MKKIVAGLAMATIVSGIVSIPSMASAVDAPPAFCEAQKTAVPPQVPFNPGCGHGS